MRCGLIHHAMVVNEEQPRLRRVNKIQVVCVLGKFVPGNIALIVTRIRRYSVAPSTHLKYLVGVCKQG